jgi:hypothetical protein
MSVRAVDGVRGAGLGHAESGATAPLVERVGRWASETIDR